MSAGDQIEDKTVWKLDRMLEVPRFVLIKMSNVPTVGILQKIEQTSIWENEVSDTCAKQETV